MSKPKLMTSNARKLQEYQRLGLDAELGGLGPDLPEVDAGPVEVALQKAWLAGPNSIVEDSSLDVEGASVGVNVRWLMEGVGDLIGRRAVFRVALAHNDGVRVSAYVGEAHGMIREALPGEEGGFGFDRWFFPDGAEGMSLLGLDRAGRKDEFSARALAARAYAGGRALEVRALSDFSEWRGAWQSEPSPLPEERPSKAGPSA